MTAPDEEPIRPVIRDNRRIDPATGQPKRGKHAASQPAGTPGASRPGGTGPTKHGKEAGASPEAAASASVAAEAQAAETAAVAKLRGQLDERTADLQRLQAEYANYRKRVDRDRTTVREQAVAATVSEMLPVLDAISHAREHGELSGGFKSVADSLQSAVGKFGLVSYGQRGDAFDPVIHEALTHTYSPDVAEDTCVEIFQPGYKVGERILRPARVAVAAPATEPDQGGDAAEWPSEDEDN